MAIKKKEEKEAKTVSKKETSDVKDSPKEDVFSQVEDINESVPEEKEEVVVDDVTKTEAVMPMSDVEGLLKQLEDRFNSKIRSITLKNSKSEMDDDAQYIADLEEDWMESPVVFFAYSFNFSIHGDKTRGKATVPPHGALHFKPIIRSKRQTARGVEVISVSSIKVNSRSVANYLRKHSHFGISFFESMEEVLSLDTGWAQRLIEANQSVLRLSEQQVIARSRQEGLPIGVDIAQMRKDLVATIAKKSIKHQEEMRTGALTRSTVDKSTDRTLISSNLLEK